MEQIQSPKSTEQRRKLLKSALAASSVAGIGYSGGALAVSSVSQCIVNQGITASVQFTGQIATVEASPYVWKEVQVNKSGNDYSFVLDGQTYTLTDTQKATMPNGGGSYPKPAWVLAYFSADRDRATQYVGAYPAKSAPGSDGTPAVAYAQASVSCAGSLGVTTTGTKNNIYVGG